MSDAFANHETERYRAFVGLLGRLAGERGIPLLSAERLESHAAGVPLLAVLYTGDPTRAPESWDVAVVLPELLRTCPAYAAATLDPVQSRVASARHGVDKFPSVVVLRGGEYVGVVEGMQDWLPFCAELSRLARAPVTTPPPLRRSVLPESFARPA